MEYPLNVQLTDEQKDTLSKFRDYVNNPKYNDGYLVRFLVARQFNFQKATKMFDDMVQWRKDEDVDNINNFEMKEIDEVRKHYPHGYYGTDKVGRPVYYEQVGKIDVKQVFTVTSEERFVKYFIQAYEYCMNTIHPLCSKAKEKLIDKNLVILDLKGIQLSQITKVKKMINLFSVIGSNYYPEVLGAMYIINAPFLFAGIWSGIKIFLDPNTQKKINIIGSNYKSELLKVIDEENLPMFLGGKSDYDISRNMGPWNPLGLEIYGSKEDIEEKNRKLQPRKSSDERKNILMNSTQSYFDDQFHSMIDEKDLELETNNQDDLSQIITQVQKKANSSKTVNFDLEIQSVKRTSFDCNLIKLDQDKTALQIFQEYHINQQEDETDKKKLKQLFDNDQIHLIKEKINYIAKKINPTVEEYQNQWKRYGQFVVFLFIQFSIILCQNTIIPIQIQLAEKYDTTLQKINQANILYLLLFGILTVIIRFSKQIVYIHIVVGVIFNFIGVLLRTSDDLSHFITGQALLGVGRPFIMLAQGQIIKTWFPPQYRQQMHGILVASMMIANIFGFIFPLITDINYIMTYQAIILCTTILPILYFFKVQPKTLVSLQVQKEEKEYNKVNIFIFILYQGLMKSFLITIPPILINKKYESKEICYYLMYAVIINMLINLFRFKRKSLFFIYNSLGIIFVVISNKLLPDKSLMILNIAMFLRQIYYIKQITNDIHQALALFGGNLLACIIYWIYSSKENDTTLQVLQLVLILLSWLAQLCVDLEKKDERRSFPDLKIIHTKYKILQDAQHCL